MAANASMAAKAFEAFEAIAAFAADHGTDRDRWESLSTTSKPRMSLPSQIQEAREANANIFSKAKAAIARAFAVPSFAPVLA